MSWCHYCIHGPQAVEGGEGEGEGGAHPCEVPLAGVRAEGDRLQLQEPRAQGQGPHLQALLDYGSEICTMCWLLDVKASLYSTPVSQLVSQSLSPSVRAHIISR